MSKVRFSVLFVLLVGAVLLTASVVHAGPVINLCTEMSKATDGIILVDIEGSAPTGALGVDCNLLTAAAPGEVGTPRTNYRVPVAADGYGTIKDSVDVFMVGSGGAPIYGFFKKPVRVCFKDEAGAKLVKDPNDPYKNPGVYLLFKDARNYQNATGRNDNQPARTVNLLNIVEAGLAKGYVCGDLAVPGTITYVTDIPTAAKLTAEHTADRCRYSIKDRSNDVEAEKVT